MNRADIEEILRIVDGAPVGELLLRTDDFTLHLLIGDRSAEAKLMPPAGLPAEPKAEPPAPAPAPVDMPADTNAAITAPMLGTFYRAEAPGSDPFIAVGAQVEPDTIVCIVEVMKMMNSVPAGVAGTIVEVLADDGTLVEFGQPLFRVEP